MVLLLLSTSNFRAIIEKEKMFDVNVEGTKNCIKIAFEKLKQNNGGVCSITSGLCKTIDPTCLTYCITKQQIMKYLNLIKSQSVKINAVLLGPILTPLLLKDVKTLKDLAEYCSLNPEKYAGCPEDIALCVIDLILSGANNNEVAIDGGESKMFRREDNKYWIEIGQPLEVVIHNKKFIWELDKSYIQLKKGKNIINCTNIPIIDCLKNLNILSSNIIVANYINSL